MTRLERQGARVFRCAALTVLTRTIGREDASVVGVKAGPLAEGMRNVIDGEG